MSISFNGTSSVASVVSSFGGITMNSAKTICGWFKATANNREQCVMTQISSDGFSFEDLGVTTTSGGEIAGFANNGLATPAFGSYSGGTWYFVYGRRAAGNNSDEYGIATSGCLFDSDGDFTTHGGDVISTTSNVWNRWYIGTRGTTSRFFGGEICCVRIFNANLTQAALRLEAVSATPVAGSCVANWRLATSSDLTSTVGSYTLTGTALSTGSTEPADITAPAPTITSINDSTLVNGQTSVVITGTNFGAAGGSAAVIISPTDNVADGSAVTQTETGTRSSTTVTFTAVQGALSLGSSLYLFVKNSDGTANTSGFPVSFPESILLTPRRQFFFNRRIIQH